MKSERILLFSQYKLLENYWVHSVIDHCSSDTRFILLVMGLSVSEIECIVTEPCKITQKLSTSSFRN